MDGTGPYKGEKHQTKGGGGASVANPEFPAEYRSHNRSDLEPHRVPRESRERTEFIPR